MDNNSQNTLTAPALLRLARTEIEKENTDQALDLLNKAIAADAYYPTPYILLGQLLAGQKKYKEAEDAFQKGSMLIGSKETFNYYISELEAVKRKKAGMPESRRVAFFSDELREELVSEQADPGLPMEERLEDLAREISAAKIPTLPENNAEAEASAPPPSDTENPPENEPSETDGYEYPAEENGAVYDEEVSPGQSVYTETMAKIYLSQGKFNEALMVYRKLALVERQNKEKYQQIIEEIQTQLDGMQW